MQKKNNGTVEGGKSAGDDRTGSNWSANVCKQKCNLVSAARPIMSIKRTGGRKPTMGNWRASIWPRANMQYVNVVISMGICIWMHARYTMAERGDTRALATCALGLTGRGPFSFLPVILVVIHCPPTPSPVDTFHPLLQLPRTTSDGRRYRHYAELEEYIIVVPSYSRLILEIQVFNRKISYVVTFR